LTAKGVKSIKDEIKAGFAAPRAPKEEEAAEGGEEAAAEEATEE